MTVEEGHVTSIQTALPREMSELRDLITPSRFMTVTTIENILKRFGFSQIEIVSTPPIENIDEALTKNHVYGSILIKKGENTLLRKGYGFSNIEQLSRNNESTTFYCGRLSELFTTRQLYSNYNLEDRLDRFFPAICTRWPHFSEISLSMLLHHTSGIDELEARPSPILDELPAEMILEQMLKRPLLFKPGAFRFESDVNYRILSAIMEDLPMQEEDKAATLYQHEGKKILLDHLSFRRGFGDAYATVTELLECAQSLLAHTKDFETKRIYNTHELVTISGPLLRQFIFGKCTYSFFCEQGAVIFIPQDELQVALLVNKPMPPEFTIKKLISSITTIQF